MNFHNANTARLQLFLTCQPKPDVLSWALLGTAVLSEAAVVLKYKQELTQQAAVHLTVSKRVLVQPILPEEGACDD